MVLDFVGMIVTMDTERRPQNYIVGCQQVSMVCIADEKPVDVKA